MAINGSSENSLLAGGTYSFDCIVESDLTPTVRWVDSNRTSISNSSQFQIDRLITSGLQTILRLTFPNLKTSLGGIYYCQSTVNEPQSFKEASRVIKVKSKLVFLCLHAHQLQLLQFQAQQLASSDRHLMICSTQPHS